MDNFTLALLIEDLKKVVQDTWLDRVQQTGATDLLLKFRHGRVFISADPQVPSLYLIKASHKSSVEPASHFTLLARKYLIGARLDAIEKVKYDRVVYFRFHTGQPPSVTEYTLVAELIERRANLYLLDAEGRLMERLLARQDERNAPGDVYAPPELMNQHDPQTLSEHEFDRLVEEAPSLYDAVLRRVAGLGPALAREVVCRAREHGHYAAFQSVLKDLFESPPHPCLYAPAPLDQIRPGPLDWKKALILSPINLRWPSEETGLLAITFASMSEAVERYGQLVEEARAFQARERHLATTLRNRITKQERLLERLRKDMERLSDYEQYRRWGELLLANAFQAERGSQGFIVTDFYDAEQRSIEIPAERNLTPQEAATAYFDLYRKGKRGVEAIEQQISRAQEDLDRWRRQADAVGTATTPNDLERLAERILGKPLRPVGKKAAAQRVEKIPGVYRFVSSEEYEILVGRSAEDNVRLTFKLARPHDVWLHAADYPGSHVVVRKSKKEPLPYRSLVEAAEIAAYFSQARHSGKVVVNYTERKYVHKIRGAAPGLVRLADFKSITVEPRIRATRIDV
jgi:predicted ribosome quality control (RQC) complex YloA/Tae2 family protein